MKQLLQRNLLLAFVMLVVGSLSAQDLWDGKIAKGFHAGNGTYSNPYQIRTGAQLKYFESQVNAGRDFSGEYVKLMNDINMNSSFVWMQKTFAGTFDGNSHFLIMKLRVSDAIFMNVSGRIHHLGINGLQTSSYSYPGFSGMAIAYKLEKTGIIDNCYYIINSTSYASREATMALENYGCVRNCYATGDMHNIESSSRTSGIVYENKPEGIVENCFAYFPNLSTVPVRINNSSSVDSHNYTTTSASNAESIIAELNSWVNEHPSYSRWSMTGWKLDDFNPKNGICKVDFVDTLFNQTFADRDVTQGQALGNLPTSTADCTLAGWTRFGKDVSSTDVVNDNWTLFARWEQRIRKQPTLASMSVEVDDIAHAAFQWFAIYGGTQYFGDWESTNHTRNSTSSKTFVIDGKAGQILSFKYVVSSEDYDEFIVNINNSQLLRVGGVASRVFTYTFPADGTYTIILKYVKDEDTNEGKDIVTVTEIKVSDPEVNLSCSATTLPANKMNKYGYYFCKVNYSNTGAEVTSDTVWLAPNITFKDATVKSLCVQKWDVNGDGQLSESEAAAVTDLGLTFYDKSQITSFDELKYFTGLKTISSEAFYNCKNLTSIALPESLTTIGAFAFNWCTGLTNIAIPTSVTTIVQYAFADCQKLRNLVIPQYVSQIGEGAFMDCGDLSMIWVNENNSKYDSRNDCHAIIETATNTLIAGCMYTTIPTDVVEIGKYAFYGCSRLYSISIPASVTTIQVGAFDCPNLTSVYVNWTTPIPTSNYVFTHPEQITLYVPEGTKEVYEAASGWKNFKEIVEKPVNIEFADAKVKQICVGQWDLDGDGELSTKEAADVTSLRETFYYRDDITSFNELEYFKGLTAISDNAFYNCYNLKSIKLPESITTIGNWAFGSCIALEEMVVPNSVRVFGEGAFSNCRALKAVNIPDDITNISQQCFEGCENLASIIIPQSVTIIYGGAFSNCSGLTEVELPENLTSMSDAFGGCSGLRNIHIPKKVRWVGNFWGCVGLESITVDADNPWVDSRNNCNAVIETATNKLVAGCKNTVIPASVTSIGQMAFAGMTDLYSIIIPDGVNSIGFDAFAETGWYNAQPDGDVYAGKVYYKHKNNLTGVQPATLIVKDGTKGIAGSATLDGLATFYLPASITHIDEYALWNSSETLRKIVLSGTTPPVTDNSALGYEYSNRVTLYVPKGSKAAYLQDIMWNNCHATKEYPNSDVNEDSYVDVVDVVDIARYVVGTPSAQFDDILADLNQDKTVSVADAVLVVKEIVGETNWARRFNGVSDNRGVLTLTCNDDRSLSLCMEDDGQYTAFQFDLMVPEGGDVQMQLNALRRQGHQLIYNKVGDGHYRVVALSLNNNAFGGQQGEVLNIQLDGLDGRSVTLDNIHFVTLRGTDHRFNALSASGATTGVQGASAREQGASAVYRLNGTKQRDSQRGVSIVKGKKYIRK